MASSVTNAGRGIPSIQLSLLTGHSPTVLRNEAVIRDPIRLVAFYASLGTIFLRFSFLHEYLTYRGGTNTYLLYVFSVPAMLGLLASGGLARAFSNRTMIFWGAFTVWLFLGIPLSTWRGDSFQTAMAFARTVIPVALMLAGLPMTWKEIRLVLYTIAAAALASVLIGITAGETYGSGRIGLEFGTVGNPNDYAGHLLLVLPIVAFLLLNPPRIQLLGTIFRLVAVLGLAVGCYFVLASGSRGALLAVLLCLAVLFFRIKMALRFAMLMAVPPLVIAMIFLLPEHTLDRFQSYSTEKIDINSSMAEAQDSARIRQHLLERSVIDTFTHPLMGVGPGQFPNYEGARQGRERKDTNAWMSPHNSYTQISSENGLPGLFFYLGGVVSTFVFLKRLGKQVKDRPEFREVALACSCLIIGLIGYCTAVMFLNFAYFYYFPAWAGIAVAMSRVLGPEVADSGSSRPAAIPVRVPLQTESQPQAVTNGSPVSGKRFRLNGYRFPTHR